MSIHTPKIRKKKRKQKRARKRAFNKRLSERLGLAKIEQYTKAIADAVGPMSYTMGVNLATYRANLDEDFGNAFDDLLQDIKEGNFE